MLALGRAFLERKGLDEARLEAELLVAHALGLDRLGLFLQLDRPLVAGEVERARELLVRRGKREPVAYITGKREFYGREFEVGPGVLVPRPETELLVDRAREWAQGRTQLGPLALADLGSGSGCLAVTLALEFEVSRVVAVDLSPEALAFTRRNAERLGARVEAFLGDGLEVLTAQAPFDLVVSNPPYVQRAQAADLAPEVRDHEPELALYAPDGDPDHHLRGLVAAAPRLLRGGGVMLIELGFDQGPRALALAERAGLPACLHQDLARIPRVLEVGLAKGGASRGKEGDRRSQT
jgi:release factor glutamine methyltransferase